MVHFGVSLALAVDYKYKVEEVELFVVYLFLILHYLAVVLAVARGLATVLV